MKLKVLLLVLGLASASAAFAQFAPIPITPGSYNADVIVESNATPKLKVVTTASVDQGIGGRADTWMERGFDLGNPGNGLPPAGTTVTAVSNANYSFKMPPSYTAPNGILIDTVVTNGTFTLTTPATYTLLSFLGSGGNGGDVIAVKVNHLDGTFEVGSFGCPDWFNGTLNVAIIANERANATSFTYDNVNSVNPRLYFRDVTLTNTTSPVTSVVLSYLSGGAGSHNDVVAMSGASTLGGPVGPIDVTGYTYDFIIEASADKRGQVKAADNVTLATSGSVDGGFGNTGNTWYERGYNFNNTSGSGPIGSTNLDAQAVAQSTGLPVHGSMVTNAAGDRVFQMPPDYTASNAVLISASAPTGTMTFGSPQSVAGLSFLAAAGNGGGNLQVVAHHADAVLETNVITVPDWFNDNVGFVVATGGRVNVQSGQFDQLTNTFQNPRMFNCDVVLLQDTNSPIVSVDLNMTNSTTANFTILAVSGTATIPPVFLAQPSSVTTNSGAIVNFSANVAANAPITYQWQKGTNNVFVNLSNGGNVSGATTSSLTLTGVGDADEADYRLVATDVVGSARSIVVSLVVLSPLNVVTAPGDTIVGTPNNGNEPGEGVEKAIDNDTAKYLNFNVTTNVGFIVTPSMGRTRVTALQLITANDATDRDPANSILEGSDNGGQTWTLINSNIVTLPDARNAGGTAVDANLTSLALRQLKFTNTNGYTMYRWTCTKFKNPSVTLMQIGEVRLLGVADTSGKPSITGLPAEAKALNTTNISNPQSVAIGATVTGTPAPTAQWQRDTGTGFVNLNDGGNISGSHSANLTVSPTSFGDQGNYRLIASNTSGASTSGVVSVKIFSTLTHVTQPTDPITQFGDDSNGAIPDSPPAAIDASTTSYENGGSGLNAQAGFAPFGGPVGLIVTPAAGPSLVTVLRIFTSNGGTERDPADYKLEGSNDGGATYTVISSGALSLPTARNNPAQPTDPLTAAVQEVRFANSSYYTSYRATFNHVRDDSLANQLQIGELDLSGVVKPIMSITFENGLITLGTSWPGELYSTTALQGTNTVWVDEGPISPPGIAFTPSGPVKFYRVQSQ